MAMLLNCQGIGKSYGGQRLFRGITMGFYEGERCGMFGPNGTGKSTLMKILAGREKPDEGTIEARRGVRVGYLAQEDRFVGNTVREEVLRGLEGAGAPEQECETRAAIILTKIGFEDHEALVATLSGGWRKRLALAREMAREPELLLLDEPTNHLDLEGILWLEKMLVGASFAYVVVTHDRYFLENVTHRVIEINPVFAEGYLSVPGNYSDFLQRREPVLEAQAKEQQALQNKVKGEIAWLKRGPKARRTKSKSRIDEAHALIGELAEVKSRNNSGRAVEIEFAATERQTRKLVAAHSLVKSMGDKLLIHKLNLVLSPGMKLGVLGPNGSGKSTLLRLLTGELQPDAGTIKRAADLKVVFFDQQRKELDKGQILREALAPGADSVVYNGQLIHISSWARRFLFRHEQLDRPVGALSGGEQARILIARLMLRQADVLVLDEPTNDLDIPSLEVLEESLEEFPGALVLVTHDRYMLDRLSTEILGLDGNGNTGIFTDYDQYENWVETRAREQARALRQEQAERRKAGAAADAGTAPKKPAKKLSFKEQREWDGMENAIVRAEEGVQKWHKAMEDPALMADREKLADACDKMHLAQERVAELYARWEELEAKRNPEE